MQPAPPSYNVIVLCIDSLRRDHLGANGNTWIRTPNLDRFARESAVFDRAYIGSFPTIPCRTDLFTGRATWPSAAGRRCPATCRCWRRYSANRATPRR